MEAAGTQLVPREVQVDTVDDDHVMIEVAGCGVCRADLEVLARAAPGARLPLTPGHEVVGTVVEAGRNAVDWLERQVVVPTVIPCGYCHHCRSEPDRSCLHPLRVGCDTHGGFASHLVLPARGLCEIDAAELARSGVALADLAALPEAVMAPYEAIARSHLQAGEVAVIVGVGDIGGFGVQLAAVLDAYVIALDTSDEALERAAPLGADHAMNVRGLAPGAVCQALRDHARTRGLRSCCWKIFETSGTAAGQQIAFELMTEGSVLALVGPHGSEIVPVRLGRLAVLDADVLGVRVHAAEHLPSVLDLIVAGDVTLDPLVERRPLGTVNETLRELREDRRPRLRRPVLVPSKVATCAKVAV